MQTDISTEAKSGGIFSSLAVPNYRLFLFGRGLSQCGTYIQTIAASWLVLQLTHSGTQIGLVVAAQFLPVLLLGAWGGTIADRFNKRRVMFVTQTVACLLVLTLGLLVISHREQLWMIYLITACLGLVNVVDNPTRQSFIIEVVGPERLKNAVTLYSVMSNIARVIGPVVSAVLIAAAGVGFCFIADAFSFFAVIVALILMDTKSLQPSPRADKATQHIRAVLAYVWRSPQLKITLIMMFLIGMFTDEFPVVFPLIATRTFHGDATTYSSMMVAVSIGSILGGLYTARHTKVRGNQVVWSAFGFGASVMLAAAMPTLLSTLAILILVGVTSVLFIALGNALLQLTSEPSMRGRVTALWYVVFIGTTAIGAPIIGYISDHAGVRIGLAVCGLFAVVASLIGYVSLTRGSPSIQPKVEL